MVPFRPFSFKAEDFETCILPFFFFSFPWYIQSLWSLFISNIWLNNLEVNSKLPNVSICPIWVSQCLTPDTAGVPSPAGHPRAPWRPSRGQSCPFHPAQLSPSQPRGTRSKYETPSTWLSPGTSTLPAKAGTTLRLRNCTVFQKPAAWLWAALQEGTPPLPAAHSVPSNAGIPANQPKSSWKESGYRCGLVFLHKGLVFRLKS